MFELEEFKLWLMDRFEPEELLLHMEITTEDILDAFPEEWEENNELLRLFGISEIEDEDE